MRVLSLGAGVQSTTLALMAAHGEIDRPDVAIFADTQWEPKRVYEHLAWLETRLPFPVIRVTAGNIRADALDPAKRFAKLPLHVDPSGILPRQCTYHYKVRPITREIRRLMGWVRWQRATESVELLMGISLDEVFRAKDNRERWIQNRFPLLEMEITRYGCTEWLKAHGYAIPVKSACIGCPFRNNGDWRDLKVNSPEEWDDAVRFEAELRSSGRRTTADGFLHYSHRLLPDVDLRTEREKGQITLDDLECEGHCGL